MKKDVDDLQAETLVEQQTKKFPKNKNLTDSQMSKLADLILNFSQKLTVRGLYPYQKEFSWRIIYSLLVEDGEEISALFGRQMGKCFKYGTEILMYNGECKPIQDISVGDSIMGDDSTPRRVLSLARGKEKMYKIVPKGNGFDPYVVNESHILSLYDKTKGYVVDIPIKDLIRSPNQNLYGYMNPVDFKRRRVPIDPYWFGVWLGDGTSASTSITTADFEVVDYIEEYAKRLNLSFKKYVRKNVLCNDYSIRSNKKIGYKKKNRNALFSKLKTLKVVNNKHIPLIYKANKESTRLKVLAGIIDSDGHKCTMSGHRNNCEIEFKSQQLAKDTQWLSRSCGFKTSLSKKLRKGVVYYKLYLYGELWKIPTKIERKRYKKNKLKYNPRMYKFDIVAEKIDNYYGFEIDGNKRFLLADFTVTHNTEALSTILPGLMVLLPLLAKALPNDTRIDKYMDGFKAAIFAPTERQSRIMYRRIKDRMFNKKAKVILKDPEIDIDLDKLGGKLELPNGSVVHCETASPQAKIEGYTLHLIICEECQDIASHIIRASIHPMGAATLASIVKIGTCNTIKSDFYETTRRNSRDDLINGITNKRTRLHFQYDHNVGAKYNPRYKKYIEKEKRRLGEDSDEFRMKYKLQWMLDRGMFINEDLFGDCGIKTEDDYLEIEQKGRKNNLKYTFKRSSNVITWDPASPHICAAIDVGRENSTVVTVGKWFPEGAVHYDNKERFPIHILNWLELQGDEHETQWPQILDFLKNYKIERVIVDATGKGDPVYSRLAAQFEELDIDVLPFLFSSQSKDEGYKALQQEISARRFTYPAGKKASTLQKWQRFKLQFQDLEKSWRGPIMVVEKSKSDKNARDDYPDSAMMLCYLINIMGTLEIEESMNPFLGHFSGSVSNMIGRASNWYAKKVYGKHKQIRPSRNRKWD